MPRTKTLATLKELEAESGLDVTTLWRKCAPRGDLPCVRIPNGSGSTAGRGATIRVKWSDFDAWLERHRIAPPSTPPSVTRSAATVLDLPGANRYSH